MVHDQSNGQTSNEHDAEFEAMVDQAEAADEAELSAFDLEDEKSRPIVKATEVPSWVYVAIWIVISGAASTLTTYTSTRLEYDFPIFTGATYMICASILTRILRQGVSSYRSEQIDIPRAVWLRTVVPLGILFGAGLILSNVGLKHLNSSSIQVLSSFIPIITLTALVMLKLAQPLPPLLGALTLVTIGLIISAGGDLQVSTIGFLSQLGATFAEPARLVLIQILIQTYALSPTGTLHLYAPISAALLGLAVPFSDGLRAIEAFPKIGLVFFSLSGVLGVASVMAEVYLIDAVGALNGSLALVLRNIILNATSPAFALHGHMAGYLVATLGLCCTLGLTSSSNGFGQIGQQASNFYQNLSGGLGSGKEEAASKRFRIIGASAVMGIIALSAFSYRPVSLTPEMDGMSPAWTATYPLDTVPQPHFESERKFTRWTLSGPGKDLITTFDSSIDIARLPRVAWVIVATESEINLYGQQILQIQCYCARAGIAFIFEHFIMVDDRHFLSARHRTTAKYLRFYQWVIVTDADFVVLDSNHDIRKWLDDSVDMVLTDRENGEICGCGYMVKNSPGGWSFIQRWVSWADHGKARMNQDNGDLIEMVHAGLVAGSPNNEDNSGRLPSPEKTDVNCLNHDEDWDLYWEMNHCVGKRFNKLRGEDDKAMFWSATLWEWETRHPAPKIKVYKPFAGWLRSAGDSQGEWSGMAEKHVGVPGEFMGHGKRLERFLNIDSILCTGKNWHNEPRLSLEEARKYVVEELNWTAYVGCHDEFGGYHCDQYNHHKPPHLPRNSNSPPSISA